MADPAGSGRFGTLAPVSARRLACALLVAALLPAACGQDGSPTVAAPSTTPTTATTTAPTAPPTTPSTAPPLPWPALPTDGVARAVTTPSGLVLPVRAANPDGTYSVQTPCAEVATVSGTPVSGAHVVLDPGHGGDEPGAVGPNGLAERDLNLAIALRAAEILRSQGATVVLTRDRDVRMTLSTRGELTTALHPMAFVSIHHNAAPDGPSPIPGTEVYFQVASPGSRRLAGLLVEEIRAFLTPFGVPWVSDAVNGARARIRADGTDHYGMLRRTAGVDAVLSEAAFISNPPEAELFARADVQEGEAQAMARAIVRFLLGESAAEAAYDPNPPSTVPAGGPGGGSSGCVDPPLS